MTRALPPHVMLVSMAAFEVIQLVAASLWIFVVLAAVGIGCRLALRIRKRRRRVVRLFNAVRVPVQIGTHGVLLLQQCERAVRPYGAIAGRKAAPQLRQLIADLRPDRRAPPSIASSGSRRRSRRTW